MTETRLIAINLDAFDVALADRFAAAGKLPAYAELRERSARFELQHGRDNSDRDTGRTGEHVSTGLNPDSTGRWSPFLFRGDDYSVVQKFTPDKPYVDRLSAKTVVFDPAYFDLSACQNVHGLVGWSGHELGANPASRPTTLAAEIDSKFGGPQLDPRLLHSNVYQSEELTAQFVTDMVGNVNRRFDIIEWMLAERFPDWEHAVLAAKESHDSIEHLYFGTDPDHPYAHLASAPIAEAGLEQIYAETTRRILQLQNLFPDANFVVFSMHGMGANRTDTPSMILLPELLFRAQFKEKLFQAPAHWTAHKRPILSVEENWFDTIFSSMKPRLLRRLRRIPNKVGTKAKVLLGAEAEPITGFARAENEIPPLYLPGAHYRRYWPQMRAFALPSLHNGIVRLNVKGRENKGRVDPENVAEVLDEVATLLRACKDNATGEPVVSDISYPGDKDPFAVNASQGDLTVHWAPLVQGLVHPVHGQIGPLPIWRTGGHSGGSGRLFLMGEKLKPGAYGQRSSYDVAPTIVELLEGLPFNRMDGESVLSEMQNHRRVLGSGSRSEDIKASASK